MLENKKSSSTKILIFLIKTVVIIWTLYLLTYVVFNEMYKDSLNCPEKDLDKCNTESSFINTINLFHPFNFNRLHLPTESDHGKINILTNVLGGYINLGFILFIIVLSSILIIFSNTSIKLPYSSISYIIITGICLLYHIINWVTKL